MLSVGLALTAALSWGISDFVGGVTSKRLALVWVLLCTQSVGLAVVLPVALARGAPNFGTSTVLFAIGGAVFGLIGVASLYRAIALGVASIAAPVSGTGAVLPVAFGLARGEPTTIAQEIGIASALLGVVLASRSNEEQKSLGRDARVGIAYSVVAALGFGGFFILLHQASTQDVWWAVSIQRATGVCIVALIVLIRRPTFELRWMYAPRLVLVGSLDVGANVLYALASTLGLVSLSSVLVSLYPMVTVLLARVLLNERMSGIQKAGVAMALAGAALVAS
ncbi:MAG: DMT family transporter [Chloroflexi bacterium]|nr:DMT family transporter [Chloroflexota bacterium]MBV9135163.1 DMT family transporter [Chloroflexota bacterium]MBV9896525.1 DMT family transporter [Chloroflexota bacterium]